MNRAMFSGVSGLKTHQTKMDVIGNNIANVNTYGFKSQRAVFSDIFYQTLSGASAPTATRGGTNPSSVGYGVRLAAIQTNMSPSSMQSTGYGLDVAIAGEGFFQVRNPDGNTYYTKAGIFDVDKDGNLVDVNGNFILGSSNVNGTDTTGNINITKFTAGVTLDQLTSIAIGSDGSVSVTHPTHGTVVAGKISLANFPNPRGLQLEGSNYYSQTANSGAPIACVPGTGGSGSLVSSALEMSNVDLSSEFADMIVTQRGFQANSRIITVSDTMLEELINLKR